MKSQQPSSASASFLALPPSSSSSSTRQHHLSSSSSSDVSSSEAESSCSSASSVGHNRLYYPAASQRSRSLLSPPIETKKDFDEEDAKEDSISSSTHCRFLVPPATSPSAGARPPFLSVKSDDGTRRERRRQCRSMTRILRRPKLHSLETSFEEGATPTSAEEHLLSHSAGSQRQVSAATNSMHAGGNGGGPFSRRNSSRRCHRGRLPSFRGSCDSESWSGGSSSSSGGGHGELAAAKSNYRIMVMGACRSGKTSIVRQFLYDQFSPQYRETAAEDMYRGEFEIHGQVVGFDIQDVSGGYVYEFPGMRNVSLSSADAFVLVFSLTEAESWEEVSRLRDMILEVKAANSSSSSNGDNNLGADEVLTSTSEGASSSTETPVVPIVVVGNKCDLDADPDIPRDSLEAIVTFDWENGYVESSAKDRRNINKIFKELLQQAKSRYDFSVPQMVSASALVSAASARGDVTLQENGSVHGGGGGGGGGDQQDMLKRRQSLPAVPAGMAPPPSSSGHHHHGHHLMHMHNPFASMMSRVHQHRSVDSANSASGMDSGGNSGSSTPRAPSSASKGGKRRSSLAALRRDSCKIS